MMVDSVTMSKLRILSEKSGHSIVFLVRELSKLASMIPSTADTVSLVVLPKTETRSIQFIVLPIFCGSFDLKTENEDMDKAIREDLKRKTEKVSKA